MIKPGVQATVDALNALLDEPGEYMSSLHNGDLDELMTECGVKYSEDDKDNFMNKVNIFGNKKNIFHYHILGEIQT